MFDRPHSVSAVGTVPGAWNSRGWEPSTTLLWAQHSALPSLRSWPRHGTPIRRWEAASARSVRRSRVRSVLGLRNLFRWAPGSRSQSFTPRHGGSSHVRHADRCSPGGASAATATCRPPAGCRHATPTHEDRLARRCRLLQRDRCVSGVGMASDGTAVSAIVLNVLAIASGQAGGLALVHLLSERWLSRWEARTELVLLRDTEQPSTIREGTSCQREAQPHPSPRRWTPGSRRACVCTLPSSAKLVSSPG